MILILARRDNYTANMLENYFRSFHELCLVTNQIDKLKITEVAGSTGEKELDIHYRGIAINAIINLETHTDGDNYDGEAYWQKVLRCFSGRVINRAIEAEAAPFTNENTLTNELHHGSSSYQHSTGLLQSHNAVMEIAMMGDDGEEYMDYSPAQDPPGPGKADKECGEDTGSTKTLLFAGHACFDPAHPLVKLGNEFKPMVEAIKTELVKRGINFCSVTVKYSDGGYSIAQLSLSPVYEQYYNFANEVDYSLYKYLLTSPVAS